jgi:hypothetical protein
MNLRDHEILMRICAKRSRIVDATVELLQTKAAFVVACSPEQRAGKERMLLVPGKKIALCGSLCAVLGGFFLRAIPSLAMAEPIRAALTGPLQAVTPLAGQSWLRSGPLADANALAGGPNGGSSTVAPSVPEPWNYLSVVATIIPVSLLYWGLRRGVKRPPRDAKNP